MARYSKRLQTKVENKTMVSKKHLIKQGLLFVCLVVQCLLLSAHASTVAGTDLIYIIDQSGSMSANGATRVANDLDGKRVQALKALSGHLVQSSTAGYTSRVSVIEFGGRHAKEAFFKPQLTVSHLVIPALAPGEPVTTVQQILKDGLLPVSAVHRGDTDHAAALNIAKQELEFFLQNPPVATAGAIIGERNQLVILITDGQPSVAKVNKKYRMSQAELTNEIQRHVTGFNQLSQGVAFIVFGFNDKSSRYWKNQWGSFWKSQATVDPGTGIGHAYLLNPPENGVVDAVAKIGELASEFIMPTSKSTSNDTYVAAPYLKALELTIDFFVPGLPKSAIEIKDPEGDLLGADKIKVESGFATAVISHPQPGVWRLRNANSRYRVKVQPVYEQAKLIEPKASVPQYTKVTFRYQLTGRGGNGQFSPQANLNPVNFELLLTTPTGVVKSYPMALDNQTGIATGPAYELDESGNYQVSLTGKTTIVDGSTSIVYDAKNSFVVNSATPVILESPTPDKATLFTLHNGKTTVPVEFVFRHNYSKNIVPPNEVLQGGKTLEIVFRPELSQAQRKDLPVVQVSPLRIDGDKLRGEAVIDFGSAALVDHFKQNKAFRFEIKPPVDPFKADISYLGLVDSNQLWLTDPYLAKESWWSLWPWILGALVILIGVILLVLRLALPWFIARGDRLHKRVPRLSYMPHSNPTYIKDISLKGVRQFKGPWSVTLSSGDTWQVEKFKIIRKWRAGSVVEVVIFYQQKGQKVREKLTLKAVDDFGSSGARNRINGLGNNESADFVLFVGSMR